MVIGINNAWERVETLIRQWRPAYNFTRITAGDLSTGTLTPSFHSRFHELIPLWVEYQYAVDNGMESAPSIFSEIQLKERELVLFYGLRNYRTFTVTIAAPGVFTLDNHGFRSGDRVIFETSGALPTGLSAETYYYVITGGLGTHTFEVSATRDSTAITTSGSQSGTHFAGVEKQKGMQGNVEDCR